MDLGCGNNLWISGNFTRNQLKLSTGQWDVPGTSSNDVTGKKNLTYKEVKGNPNSMLIITDQ
ncbi:hypothetical protein ABVT39_025937 [Epinephelus coioides]